MTWIEASPGSCIFYKDGLISQDLCNEIIQRFERSSEVAQGTFGTGILDTNVKDTLELSTDGEEWADCNNQIMTAYNRGVSELVGAFPGLKNLIGQRTGFQIQKYKRQRGHYNWHTDVMRRDSIHRLVAFIIYLNTVKVGGQTEFQHQQVQIQPEAGRILMFPPFWTHLHRGCVPLSSDKYILTNFLLC